MHENDAGDGTERRPGEREAGPPRPMRRPPGRGRTSLPIARARAREDGRGRDATSPWRIPPEGLRDVFWRVLEGYGRDRIAPNAAGAAFFLVFAIVPSLAALVALFGLVADPEVLSGQLDELEGFLPVGLLELIASELDRLIAAQTGTLTATFAITLAIALWIINSAVLALFDALNVIYGEREKRSLVSLYGRSFAFTLATLVFTMVLVNVVVGVPVVLQALPLGGLGRLLIAAFPTLVLFFVANVGIAALYRYGPSRVPARWRWISPGSLTAAAVWLVGSAGFSYYVSNLTDFSATYGSLGTIAAVMMWAWISTVILLVGAEVDAEMEHQTAADTTRPPDAPLGARGAVVADQVGAARVDTGVNPREGGS
ncbi:YihY/virulence factor BrkB family protein [Salinarimonas chemoclinalis]|uniref:YihY/virulence factor BrkB family protein n=1 Tax=Salinarimonas chemoclinalis TaxID=3241599 RepID=UPI003557E245